MIKYYKKCVAGWALALVTVNVLTMPARAADVDPRIEKLTAAISEQRLREIDTKLASFETRNTLSDTTSTTRGIGAARQWIFDELKRSSPKLQVSFDTYQIAPQGRITRQVELRNVMAVLPGKTSRRIYITGHYDSLNIGPGAQIGSNREAANAPAGQDVQRQPNYDHNVIAPGANDDGSGTSLTMELARVFAQSGVQFDATLVFMCWAGEEQGLIGSHAHAQALQASKAVVEAMISNDIVGNTLGGNGAVDNTSVRLYSIGPEDSMSRSLARYIERVATMYVPSHRVRLMAREDRFRRGSDQSAFTQAGFPAVVFRESNENFARQHSADDTLEGVDFAYLTQNARVNAAAAAALALAPAAPIINSDRGQPLISRDPSGYDATLRWKASPGAVGYKVYWRDTWGYDWQHGQVVGNVTEYTLKNTSIDNYVFGVAAVSADGHESLVSAYVSTSRADAEVKVVK